jgi:hypothetical protein
LPGIGVRLARGGPTGADVAGGIATVAPGMRGGVDVSVGGTGRVTAVHSMGAVVGAPRLGVVGAVLARGGVPGADDTTQVGGGPTAFGGEGATLVGVPVVAGRGGATRLGVVAVGPPPGCTGLAEGCRAAAPATPPTTAATAPEASNGIVHRECSSRCRDDALTASAIMCWARPGS